MAYHKRKLYRTNAWIKLRKFILVRDRGVCTRCGNAGYIAHHVIYVTDENENDPSITLNPDNLILVCQTCHNKIHMGNAYVRDNVEFDSNGRLVAIVNKITGTGSDDDSGNII